MSTLSPGPLPLAIPHPLIATVPRLAAPLGAVLRWAAIARLKAGWNGGRLDVVIPTGERIELGGGGAPEATATVHDDRLFLRMLLRGEMGFGEGFVAGDWSADDLVGVIRVFLRATVANATATTPVIDHALTGLGRLPALWRHRRSANTRGGSAQNIHAHYDLGNAFYQLFLDDETLAYSCGIQLTPEATLADAQRAKFDALCDALELSPRDHLLEIGCGWGGMAIHAARTRGCRVTAITVSHAQHQLATERVAAAGLADRVTIEYRDYRDLEGTFDKIVSIEMLEAVGYEFLPRYFATCARVLAPNGRLAIQSITMPDERFEAYRKTVDWMQTYVFPGSLIPSLGAIGAASASAGLQLESARDIGPDYAPTLRAWKDRFVAALPAVRALGFDAPFVRTWLLYLGFSE
ncbi:MAG: cyclopropane-fatty-acyl-phospholipid synthase, partial [Proteobacteria bacterium]|nr:cyclopropane-fatty-acyl-phospholipid synthase [Pseudomonadota bacterium]